MRMRITTTALAFVFSLLVGAFPADAQSPWPAAKADAWHAHQPWLVGCNFTPSTAINQLEMWQAETWDPATIDRELGWAQDLGFTSMRVFLHDLAWRKDRAVCSSAWTSSSTSRDKPSHRGDVRALRQWWDPFPKPGKQRAPYPHRHNSGWVQSPGGTS